MGLLLVFFKLTRNNTQYEHVGLPSAFSHLLSCTSTLFPKCIAINTTTLLSIVFVMMFSHKLFYFTSSNLYRVYLPE